MKIITAHQQRKKYSFKLTRQNQSGQVAIFVALIFQVVFVFFALLINVGLLVHHKINLQHSTDLAAYYGAMKQAEQMNAISHINFQMRQAWKLFTWRYRVLGTFGFLKDPGKFMHDMPFTSLPGATPPVFRYYGTNGAYASSANPYRNGTTGPAPVPNLNCTGVANQANYEIDGGAVVGLQDIPFFCIGHSGFAKWSQSESNCQISCDGIINARPIAPIATLPTATVPFGGNVTGSVNQALNQINTSLQNKCELLGPTGAKVLSRFIAAYVNEYMTRSETIKMLAANLSQDADSIVDLDGESIKKGSERTFKNNLTGANFTGLTANAFTAYNGLSDNNCRFSNGNPDDGRQFLKRIEFKLLNLFIHNCKYINGSQYLPESVFTSAGGLSTPFADLDAGIRNVMTSIVTPGTFATIGYEKNPNCVEYYAVKSTSEPNIPFLPLSKIKLSAVSIAKPFGGSIGPWYGVKWDKSATKSEYTDDQPNTKMDSTLPMRDFIGDANATIIQSVYSQPNFSLFVGDKLGVRNLDYLAANHSMLAVRDINLYPGAIANENPIPEFKNSGTWPDYPNWDNLTDSSGDMRNYDSLASPLPMHAGTRGIEITAIAPNQFDLFHYSIDPDFYNNYYVRIYKAFDAIKSAAGNNVSIDKNQLRADFGAVSMDGNSGPTNPLELKTFSVKDQILLKNIVLNKKPKWYGNGITGVPPAGTPAGLETYDAFLNYLVGIQASLLTGWTFLKFNDYLTFPMGNIDKINNSMSFGQCLDEYNNSVRSQANKTQDQDFKNPMSVSNENPPAVGNCVTGGRTGYSVKLITPAMVGASSDLINPLDPGFFNF